jgi:hypothetical protein
VNIEVKIPAALEQSEEYQALSEEQKRYFLQRLDGIQEIGCDLANEASLNSATDFYDFASDLELDVVLRQELSLAEHGSLSRWLIHHSWTFLTSPREMADQLPGDLLALSDLTEPKLGTPTEAQAAWLRACGIAITRLVEEFSSSATFSRALAVLILLDIVMAKLLVACFKLRLNPHLAR